MHRNKNYLASFILLATLNTNAVAESNHYESALTAFEQKKTSAAHIHIKNALKNNPNNLPAKILLAKILLQLKSFQLAEQEIISALRAGADINLLISSLIESLLKQGKYTEVLDFVDQQKLTKVNRIKLELAKAMAYRGLKEVDRSKDIYQAILANEPNNFESLIGLTTLYAFEDNKVNATKFLNKASKISPNSAQVWYLKGLLALPKEPNLAIINFKKSLQIEPENVPSLKSLINILINEQEFRQAINYINTALNILPNDPHILYLKSTAAKGNNNNSLAAEVLADLSGTLSNIDESYILSQPELLLLDAMTSYSQQNWLQAREKFIKYIKQDESSTDINIIMLLADVHIQLDENKLALELLEENEINLLKNKSFSLILANLYIKFEQHFKANYVIDKLYKDYPNDPSVLILYANMLLKEGKASLALTTLKKKNDNKNPDFQHTLAVLSLETNDIDNSLKYIKSAIKLSPNTPEYQLFQIEIVKQKGQEEKALELITSLRSKFPNNDLINANYALFKLEQGELTDAKEIFEQLTQKNDNDANSWLILAEINYSLGEKEEAIKIYEKIVKNSTLKRQAYLGLAQLYLSEKQYNKTLEISNILLNSNRLDDLALEFKSKALIATNKSIEAKRYLNILFSLWQNEPTKLHQLGLMHQRINNYNDAEKVYMLALEKNRTFLPLIIDTIKLKIRLRKLNEAIALLSNAEKLSNSKSSILTILRGDIEKVQNRTTRAFNLYRQALNLNDENVIALIKLAQVSYSPSLSNKFITFVEALLTKYPQRSFERNILADHLMEHNQYDKAKFHYQMLLTQNIPMAKRGFALNNLAVIATKNKDYAVAIQFANQAIEIIRPNKVPAIIDTLGWALSLSGEYEEGLGYLREAYAMASTQGDIQYHIAHTLVQLNRKAEAKTLLLQTIELPNDFAEYKLAEQLLAGL